MDTVFSYSIHFFSPNRPDNCLSKRFSLYNFKKLVEKSVTFGRLRIKWMVHVYRKNELSIIYNTESRYLIN
jgi:hypothetical protein